MMMFLSPDDAGGAAPAQSVTPAPAPAPATAPAPAAASPAVPAAAIAEGLEADSQAKAQAAWTSLLPAELRDHAELKGYAKPGDFVKAALGWKEGQSGLKVPGKDASEEERNAFFAALGMPAKPEDYELAYPEGAAKDEGLDAWIRQTAHAAKLTKGQAAVFAQALAGLVVGGKDATAKSREAAEAANRAAIEKKYGPEAQRAAEMAKRGIGKSGMTRELYTKLQAAGLTGDPDFFDFAVRLGKTYEEDGFIRSGTMPEKEPSITDFFSYPTMRQ